MNGFSPTRTWANLSSRWFASGPSMSRYPSQARTTSTWIIGQPGMGKSKFIESQVIQDISAGRGVGLIDIHGDLHRDVLRSVAALAQKDPQLAERVVIFDPTQPDLTVSLNPLEAIEGISQERTALFLTDIVMKIWDINANESPRLVWLLTNTFLAVANLNLTLADFPRWLQDKEWRNQHVPMIAHEAVYRYWAHEFPQADKEIRQWIAPATNKLGGLLFDSDVRHALAGKSNVTMRQIMDEELILLAHIPKGILGEKSAHLLAAFIVAQLQKAALSRADVSDRRFFVLYLDEFQNYTTDYIQDVLAESRKYSLSLVVANQFLEQLNSSMRSAVLNTSGTIISFRVGYKDAAAMVHEIFPYSDFPLYAGDIERGTWERLALDMANLPPRAFWVRRRGPYQPAKKRTLDMPELRLTQALERATERLQWQSAQRYAQNPNPQATALDANKRVEIPVQKNVAVDPVPTKNGVKQHEEFDAFGDILWDE